jgi:hypothetical protein
MARVKRKAPSTRSYFKKVFSEHPEWLEDSSTEAVLARWQKDHAGKELTASIKSSLSNIKSQLRKDKGLRKKGRRKGRRRARVAAASAVEARKAGSRRLSTHALEKLETMIDSCLSHARIQATNDLAGIIHHLRLARNTVIHKLGQG